MRNRRLLKARSSGITPPPTLVDLGLDDLTWDLAAPAGTVLATFVGKAAGSTVTVTPNDGRITVSPDSTQIIRGGSAAGAGPVSVQMTEANAGSSPPTHISPPLTATFFSVTIPDLFPAAGFNGTEGSGYGGAGVAAPTPSVIRATTDPSRPTISWAEDDRRAMVADDIQTFASFCEGGVAKVRVFCEGNFVDITTMSARTRVGYDGNSYVEWGYHANLKHASFPASGWCLMYATAYPVDGTQLPQTIGPLRIKRKVGAYYDATLTVGAGQTYTGPTGLFQAINAAVPLAKRVASGGSGFDHIRIKPVGTITNDIDTAGNLTGTGLTPGHLDIMCDPGDSILLTKGSDGGVSQYGFDFEGVRLCRGVRLDMKRFGVYFAAYDNANQRRAASFCGCEVFNSAGYAQLAGTSMFDAEKSTRGDTFQGGVQGMRLFEVYWHDMHIGPVAAQQIRNTRVDNCSQDMLRPCSPNYDIKLMWSHYYNVQITNDTLVTFDVDTPALTLKGPATMTFEIIGIQPDSGAKQIVFKRSGTEVWRTNIINTWKVIGGVFTIGTYADPNDPNSTFTPISGTATYQYYIHDVFLEITAQAAAAGTPGVGMNGVVAVELDNTKRAAAITTVGHEGLSDPITPPTALSPTVPATIITRFDIHGDGWQSQAGPTATTCNINMVNSSNIQGAGQIWFADYNWACDIAVVNCTWSFATLQATGTSMSTGLESHVFYWHVTEIGQSLRVIAPDADAKCAWRSCVMTGLYSQGPVSPNMKFVGNFLLQERGETPPSDGAGYGTNYVGSTPTTLLVDPYNSDFTPKAAVLAHLQPQLVPFDRLGVVRGSLTAAGAQVAAAGG